MSIRLARLSTQDKLSHPRRATIHTCKSWKSSVLVGTMGNRNSSPPAPYPFIQCQGVDCCNGVDGLCDFGPDEIMWATSHNAMSSREGGLPLLYNNLFELEDALETGYRGLKLDVCNCNGNYQFCHGICFIGARPLDEVSGSIVDFLQDHPTEIILITFQLDSGADEAVSLDDFYDDLNSTTPELFEMTYVHPENAVSWPTLGELKTLGKVSLQWK